MGKKFSPKDDPHANSRPPQGGSSPLGARSEQENPLSVQNDKEPTSKALLTEPIDLADPEALLDAVQEEAKRLPDIRQERVDQIRAALQSGEYQISSDLIADRIIQDTLLNESSTED